MKKVFFGIIIIIILTVVIAGGFFAWQYLSTKSNPTAGLPIQSQQATEGWKTYTNTQYGFEIRYPNNFEIHTNSNIVESKNYSGLPDFVVSLGDIADLGISKIDAKNARFSDLIGFANDLKSQYQFEHDEGVAKNLPLPTYSNLKTDSGEDVFVVYATDSAKINHTLYYMVNNGFLISIVPSNKYFGGGTNQISESDKSIIENFVKSFKFTK